MRCGPCAMEMELGSLWWCVRGCLLLSVWGGVVYCLSLYVKIVLFVM